jgi:hypothetical protein
VVDGGGLENHCTGNGTGGSNPSPSAILRSRSRAKDALRSGIATKEGLPLPAELRMASQPIFAKRLLRSVGRPRQASGRERSRYVRSLAR